MKNNTMRTVLLILGCFFWCSALAQDPDHTFTYQGELLDSGSPADGNYDITLSGFFNSTGGNPQGMVSTHLDVAVSNGLFTLNNVDLVGGVNPFDGLELWLEIAVRQAGDSVYTTLAPRQLLHAVPYAAKLTNGTATAGQVYTYSGSEWEAANPVNNSPWIANGNNLSFTSGNVGIGVSNPGARLEVVTTDAIPVKFEGGDTVFNTYYENGIYRGYVGSFQSSNAADFEIGTGILSAGNMHITTGAIPRITVSADGTTSILGDTKQSLDTNGLMKYMVEVFCSSNPTLVKSYNGVVDSGGDITVEGGILNSECAINFPDNISNRYWQVSTISSFNRLANCIPNGTNQLLCITRQANTGAAVNGGIMVMVY